MALHAVSNIDDAVSVTQKFLFPFDLRRWLKLVLVSLFVGGGMSLPTGQFQTSGNVDPSTGAELGSLPFDPMAVIVPLVAVFVVLGVLFSIVGAIMEFVLVESLRTDEVAVRRHWGRRWRQGLRLFGFRLVIGLPLLGIFAGWFGLLFAPTLFDGIEQVVPFGTLLLVGIPVVFLVALLYALVASFTTVFVVPIMIETDSGVVAAWGRLWKSIKSQPKQYLAYAALGFALSLTTGILASLAVAIAAVVLALPVAVLGVVLYLTVSFSSTAVFVVLALLGVLVVAAVVALWLVVQVPVLVYLRYYALLVLGDIEASFDLVPDRHEVVRD